MSDLSESDVSDVDLASLVSRRRDRDSQREARFGLVRDARSPRVGAFPTQSREARAGRFGSEMSVSVPGRDTRLEGSRDARDVTELLSDVNARVSLLNRDVSRALRGELPRGDLLGSRRDSDDRERLRKRERAHLLSTRVESDPGSLFTSGSSVHTTTRNNKPLGNNVRNTDPIFFFTLS